VTPRQHSEYVCARTELPSYGADTQHPQISCDDSSYACLGVQCSSPSVPFLLATVADQPKLDADMDKAWGSGDPTKDIDTSDHVVFDDHGCKPSGSALSMGRKLTSGSSTDAQWIASDQSPAGYLNYLCTTTRSSESDPSSSVSGAPS